MDSRHGEAAVYHGRRAPEKRAVDTSFELPPGTYTVKVVIRENQIGTVGSLETTMVVPDIEREPLKVSSVVLSSQRQAAASKKGVVNPLVRNGQELIANVPHVVSATQPLYFYYEVYDPAQPGGVAIPAAQAPPRLGHAALPSDARVLSNVVLQGSQRLRKQRRSPSTGRTRRIGRP